MSAGKASCAGNILHLLSDSLKTIYKIQSLAHVFKCSEVWVTPPKASDNFGKIGASKRSSPRFSIVCLFKTRVVPVVIPPCMDLKGGYERRDWSRGNHFSEPTSLVNFCHFITAIYFLRRARFPIY